MFGGHAGCGNCGSFVPAVEIENLRCAKCRVIPNPIDDPKSHIDEIVPGLFLGDISAATSKKILRDYQITHIVDACNGKLTTSLTLRHQTP